jgi:hypothetical protein
LRIVRNPSMAEYVQQELKEAGCCRRPKTDHVGV